jgi:leader peptidase (prepilin peptidase)/N-methyltransferase
MLADIFMFLVGLCIGSFLNVCIYRIPLEKSIAFPPSSCPECGSRIKARDLIPVLSYIILRGKCRGCKAKISLQYPLIELITGLIFFLTYRFYGFRFETFALIFLFSILIPVAFIDLKHMIIPNGLVLTGLAGGAAVFLYHIFYRPYALYGSELWYAPLLGMLSASGILFVIAAVGILIYKDDIGMGMGDVKIFLPIGLFLGWKLSLLALFIAVLLAGIVGVILLILRVFNRKSAIPLGPFIVIATVIIGLLGSRLSGIL